ncbi:MAG: WYL domain-containing protein [Pseudomonadales bacterium]|nr:WYL domain-containing protein [Pseudomonadales bacterium]
MDKFDRIQQLHRILKSRRLPVPKRVLAEELECSERQIQRLIENLKIVDAPLEYDQSAKGWYYAEDPNHLFELPGLWLTSDELQSLSLLINLLENLGNGLLNDEIGVIEKEVNALLKARGISPSAFINHIKVLPIAHRQLPGRIFSKVSEALLKKRVIGLHYTSYNGTQTQREVSPQTLIHYRENWYLDAWCHLRQELRTFSIARITRAEIHKTTANAIDKALLNEHFTNSYGIFAGKAKHTAKLRFSREIAREIALQQWHPEQKGEWQGREYLLTIPYADDRELLQDLLRHTPHVYVEAPVKLRKKLQNRLQQGLELQRGKELGWL